MLDEAIETAHQELEELSEAVLDEDAARAQPELATLQACVDELAARVTNRTCVGVVVVDASNLGAWERQNGAAAFTLVMGRLASAIRGMAGTELRADDRICFDQPGGESLLIFLGGPRNGGPPIESDEIVDRVNAAILLPFETARLRQATDRVTVGSALIIHNDSVDPRREIYRAIRKARSDAEVSHRERQRRRHRVVGSVISQQKINSFYQPIVDLSNHETIGFEALSRATDGDSKALGTHIFVAAHKAELDGELDSTCRELSIERRPELGEALKLFVNCLPTAFYEPMRELEQLLGVWEQAGLSPSQLVFELTEDITADQLHRIMPNIDRLRERGHQFALDDVGTGTANFQILTDLEPDYIKMDISLTRGIALSDRKRALASHLLDFARSSNARLIAEGIENEADHEVVVDLGIPLGQGYLLGYPFPAATQP